MRQSAWQMKAYRRYSRTTRGNIYKKGTIRIDGEKEEEEVGGLKSIFQEKGKRDSRRKNSGKRKRGRCLKKGHQLSRQRTAKAALARQKESGLGKKTYEEKKEKKNIPIVRHGCLAEICVKKK